MTTTFWGIISIGAGAILKAIIDACVERYKKAQEIKDARDSLESHLRSQVFLWREHAYTVRVVAVKAGVSVEELPPLPKED